MTILENVLRLMDHRGQALRRGAIAALALLLAMPGGVQAQTQAREPFLAPVPPLEAYDFPDASETVELRGLVVAGNNSRAVVLVTQPPGFQVLRPNDELRVTYNGLRHVFRVLEMGQRRLVLLGEDGEHYEIRARTND